MDKEKRAHFLLEFEVAVRIGATATGCLEGGVIVIRQRAVSFLGFLLQLTHAKAAVAASCLTALMLVCSSASAIPANPDPANYADDTGVSLFLPGSALFALKLTDPLPGFGFATAFGFYRAGTPPLDPANLAILFDFSDAPLNVAAADFSAGLVFDVDAGNVVEDSFTPGIQPIGFVFLFTPFGGGPITALYSEPGLNGGVDVFAAFRSLTTPDQFLLDFELPIPGGPPVSVSLELAGPLAAVPEPGSLALILAGLLSACIAFRSRRFRTI